ncbi:MAG: hypothetical protein AAF844_10725 [Pseudomonadota bacterium]
MGWLFVTAMFVGPAYVALNGMFGSDMVKVLRGETEDRVKYVRDEPAPARAPAKTRSKKAAAASE